MDKLVKNISIQEGIKKEEWDEFKKSRKAPLRAKLESIRTKPTITKIVYVQDEPNVKII